jgi:hypothetical protein
MKVTAKITLTEFNITAGREYEIIKEIESPEIGILYQILADDGKVKNLKATHFSNQEEKSRGGLGQELIYMHRRQYKHNLDSFQVNCSTVVGRILDREEDFHVDDMNDFLEETRGYLMAMMFHINSLRIVGLDI